eukprot:5662889-Pleurochrysis_carterae.AAC.1
MQGLLMSMYSVGRARESAGGRAGEQNSNWRATLPCCVCARSGSSRQLNRAGSCRRRAGMRHH